MRVSLFAVLALTLSAASLSACGGSSCGSNNCGGCCDASGICQNGNEASACGANGAACSACGGGLCIAGMCRGSSGSGNGSGNGNGNGTTTNGTSSTNGTSATTSTNASTNATTTSGTATATATNGTTGTTATTSTSSTNGTTGTSGCGSQGAGCTSSTCCSGLECDSSGTCQPPPPACANDCPTGYSCNAQAVCAGGDPTQLVFNVITPQQVTVSGQITHNGSAQICSSSYAGYGAGTISFSSKTSSNYSSSLTIYCQSNGTATYTGTIYVDTYDVSVSAESGYGNLPYYSVDVGTNVGVTGNSTLNFDVQTPQQVTVSGQITHNGSAQICSSSYAGYGAGTISFSSKTSSNYSSSLTIYCQSNGTATYTGTIYVDTYDVSVSAESGYGNLPYYSVDVGTNVGVTGNSTLNFDVQTPQQVTVSGQITHNGSAQICSSSYAGYGAGTISFSSKTSSNYSSSLTIYCQSNGTATYTGTIYVDTYDVSVSAESGYGNLPYYTVDVGTNVGVTGNSTLNFDVQTPQQVTVSGQITHNGSAQICSSSYAGYGAGTISFSSKTSSNYSSSLTIYCQSNGTATYTGTIYVDTYDVSVSAESGYGNLPYYTVDVGTNVGVTGNSTLNFDVQTPQQVTVSGQITHNGSAQICSSSYAGYGAGTISFSSKTSSNYSSSLTIYCQSNGTATYTGTIYVDTYDVSVSAESGYGNLPYYSVDVGTNVGVTANSTLNFDVQTPQQVTVSGQITHNGSAQICSSSYAGYGAGTISFSSKTSSNYSSSLTIYCQSDGTATFTGQVYTDTYDVSVSAESGYGNLPYYSVDVTQRLAIP